MYKESTKWNEAGLVGEINIYKNDSDTPMVIKITGDMSLGAIAASLQSAIKDKGNSEEKVEYKDGRFNITGLTNDVIIKGVDGNVTNSDGSNVTNPDGSVKEESCQYDVW